MKTSRIELQVTYVTVWLALCILASSELAAAKAHYMEFDPPGSTLTGVGGINAAGQIVGYYYDKQSVIHGYLRGSDGTFVLFDAPGAGANSHQGTTGSAVNDHGVVAGNYLDVNGTIHSFIRSADGTITDFDPPFATSSQALGINNDGAIVGYGGAGGRGVGYLRNHKGAFTPIDAPGEGGQGTLPASINNNGDIVGSFADDLFVTHGFVQASDGTITTFDVVPGTPYTEAQTINSKGLIAGEFASGSVLCGYVRALDGTFTTFPSSAVSPADSASIYPKSINDKGVVVGEYYARTGVHGFERFPDGSTIVVNPLGATYSRAVSVNSKGAVVGEYRDSQNVIHGFLLNK